MRRAAGLIVIAGAFSVAIAAAQQTPRDLPKAQAAVTATLSGTLLDDEADPKPVRRARVTLTSDSGGSGWTTVSDDQGRFAFTAVPAGRFTLGASKEGFVPATYGARRPGGSGTPISLAAGQQTTDVTLRVLRGAVVTGTVRDDRGRPAPGVRVSVMRWEIKDGARALGVAAEGEGTDDRGVFRIYGLAPGDYLLRAGASAPTTSALRPMTSADVARVRAEAARGQAATPVGAAAATPQPSPMRGYTPVYYPGTTDATAATPITLKPGEVRSDLDLALVLIPTASIIGTVSAPAAVAPQLTSTSLQVMSDDGQPVGGTGPGSVVHPDAAGHFTVKGLAPGTYTVLASLGSAATRVASAAGGRGSSAPPDTDGLFATAAVSIQDSDAIVSLALQPGARISGRVVFNGKSPKPVSFTPYRLGLVSVDHGPRPLYSAFSPDGTFVVAGVAPGRYLLTWSPPADVPWALQSATAGGHDLLDTPLEIAPAQVMTDATITFSDTPTEFSGLLQDASGRPTTDYFVVVFARDKARWRPDSRWVAAARPGTDGRFLFRGLPHGEYVVAALTDVEPGEWFLPGFLENLLAQGSPVTLTAGHTTVQDFKIK